MRHLFALALTCALTLSSIACPDATEVATQCVAADLVAQCPAGSSPVLGAAADSACGGSFELKVITEEGAATGQCSSNGSCEFLCQYTTPCTCGVATLSKEQIVCAECPDQSCGDGRCEGTERASCTPDDRACFACFEDCGGATCGDGDCTGSESPATCPQDCEDLCTPNAKTCVGAETHVCAADGRSENVFDCATIGLICGGGECVAPGACGNKACESDETTISCPEDCATTCVPSSAACQGNTLVTCNANGTATTETDCAAEGLVCGNGACKTPNVCGNDLCEAGESESCPDDCAATCGNRECENGEQNSCPQDCTVCGDRLCGAGEIESCPQDCGVCVPSERFCLGALLRVCNANGTDFEDIDCSAFDQSCVSNNCVEPGLCGNGACEAGEDLALCPEDCTDVCGDDVCQDSESFTTCSADCDPSCGDASCQGGEDSDNCALDCLVTCGNGACDGAEDRDGCPKDCGYCGNGTCEDAAESASLFPAAPLVTCLEDCVVSGCDTAGDCDDGIFCTTGACNDGVCHYTASDELCPVDEKCIKFSGCCPDQDRDGFADAACGGSDCDDADNLVYPGAVEPCGGGDRNCSGGHRPQLKTVTKVTNTTSYKSALDMTWDGTRFWAAWRGVPEAVARVELVRIARDGTLVGAIQAVPESVPKPTRVHVAWSPQSNRLGVAWDTLGSGPITDGATFTTVSEAGVISSEPLPHLFSPPPGNGYAYTQAALTGMVWLDGVWVMSDAAWANNGAAGFQGPYGWWAATESGEVTRRFTGDCYFGGVCFWGATSLFAGGGQVIGHYSDRLMKIAPTDTTGALTTIRLTQPEATAGCIMDWDGEGIVLVCRYFDQVTYQRLAPNGATLESVTLRDQRFLPVAMATAIGGLGAGDNNKIGVLGQDGTNLIFMLRDLDGSEVVEPGVVGGGVGLTNPQLFWDGDAYQAFWLAKAGDIEQVFRTTITCE